MSSEWPRTTFDQLCDIKRGASPRPIHDWLAPTGIPWVKISDATASSSPFISKTAEFIRPEGAKKSVEVFPGDFILSNSATPGIPKFMQIHACVHDGWMLLRNFRALDPWYCYYLLQTERENLIRQGNGSVFTNLKTEILKKHEVAVPPLKYQQQVAQFLRLLDDRITLLRETNTTIEAIAQALFKSWFVDFDPVHAKMQGLAPEGMDEVTAALFPGSFEESDLGPVPKGWVVTTVGDAVETIGGATPDTKTADYWEPTLHHWTTPKDLSGIASPALLDTERKLSDAGLKKISSGLLPQGTLLMSSRAPIGYLAVTQVPLAINQGYIAIPPGGKLTPLHMLFWCQTNMENIKSRANGSTFMEISKKAFRPIPILVPSRDTLNAFEDVASGLFERLVENERQAQNLANIRDALLPRLISGQIQMQETTEKLQEAEA